jgi:hypothetical protein
MLKGGDKFVHILEEECFRELIVWPQEFVPPPTCFLAKWIIWTCWDDESSSHSLFWAKHLGPTTYKHGQKDHRQRDYKGHMRKVGSWVHKCWRWLVHSWSTFGARTNHGQIRTHKTHHGPELGEATNFALIIYYVFLHKAHIQMTYCPKTPKWEFRNSQNWDFHDFGAP